MMYTGYVRLSVQDKVIGSDLIAKPETFKSSQRKNNIRTRNLYHTLLEPGIRSARNTRYFPNAVSMLRQRLWRWTNIETALDSTSRLSSTFNGSGEQ